MNRFLSVLGIYTTALFVCFAIMFTQGVLKQMEVNESVKSTVTRAQAEARRERDLKNMVAYDQIKVKP